MTADVEAERWVPMSLRRADGERGLLRALLMEAVRCALGEAGVRRRCRGWRADDHGPRRHGLLPPGKRMSVRRRRPISLSSPGASPVIGSTRTCGDASGPLTVKSKA